MPHSVGYNLGFATAVCVVCAVIVSSSAVSLRERQELNAALDKQRNVLVVAGLANEDERLTGEEIEARSANIDQIVIDLTTGELVPGVDPVTFDQRKVASDPATSRAAPSNLAGVERVPNQVLIYEIRDDDQSLQLLVLPVEGRGLWSTLYGFVALGDDLRTIQGLTFYEHKETPGLGGEVDNPRWKALWPGREVFNDEFDPVIEVIKGRAGSVEEDPHSVDGLSGATMTSRGVTNLLRFWFGPEAFGPYLQQRRDGRIS